MAEKDNRYSTIPNKQWGNYNQSMKTNDSSRGVRMQHTIEITGEHE